MILDAGADPLNKATEDGFREQTTDEELAAAKGGEIAARVSAAARKFRLAEAAGAGDLATVNEFLESGVPVDTVNLKSQTALVTACIAGKTETAKVLLLHGANPNVVCFERWEGDITPLSAAMKHNDSALFEALVSHGADVTRLHGKKGEPVFFAVLKKPVKFVDVLLEHGADPNAAQEKTGRTVIYSAIAMGDLSLVEHLIEGGACVNRQDNEGVTPTQLAEQLGNSEIAKVIKAQYSREMDEIAEAATLLNGSMTPLKALKFRLGKP
jgi:ankyrin repeat protein